MRVKVPVSSPMVSHISYSRSVVFKETDNKD